MDNSTEGGPPATETAPRAFTSIPGGKTSLAPLDISDPAAIREHFSDFFGQPGFENLDITHAHLQHYLEGIDSEEWKTNEIRKMRAIMFKGVTDILGTEEPENKPFSYFDIQDVRSDTLHALLNDEHLLDANIPTEGEILPYVSSTTADYIKRLYDNLKTTHLAILSGPTGVAKTTMVKTLAAHLNLPIYQETGTGEKIYSDLTSKVVIRPREGHQDLVEMPSGLIQAAVNGGIYLLDEFNNLEEDVQTALVQIVDSKEILLDNGRRIPIHDNFFFVITNNPQYFGTHRISDTVIRRAGGMIEVGYLPSHRVVAKIDENNTEISLEKAITIKPTAVIGDDIKGKIVVDKIDISSYEVTLEKAQQIDPSYELGDIISEEAEVAYNVYKHRIRDIAKKRNSVLSPSIPLHEINQLVMVFNVIRFELLHHDPSSEVETEDKVNSADNFSIRKIIDILIFAEVSKEAILQRLLNKVMGTLPPVAKEIMKRAFNKYNTITFGEPEEMEEDEVTREAKAVQLAGEVEESVAFLTGKSKNRHGWFTGNQVKSVPKLSVITNADVKNTLTDVLDVKGSTSIKVHGGGVVEVTHGRKFASLTPPIQEVDLDSIEFDFIRDNAAEVQQEKKEVKSIFEDRANHKKAMELARTLIKGGKMPVFRRMKKVLSFDYEGQKGFVLFGFEARFADASYGSLDEDKLYVPHKHRLRSIANVFIPDETGESRFFINPETGETRTLNKEEYNEEISQALIEAGFIPGKFVHPKSKNSKDAELAKLVKNKIRLVMTQASDFSKSNKEELLLSRSIPSETSFLDSSFEGRDLTALSTGQSLGKHIEYQTTKMQQYLRDVRIGHMCGTNVLLKGPSGTGKTSIAKTYALQAGLIFVDVQFHKESTESSTLKAVKLTDGRVIEVSLPLLNAYEFGWVAELRELNTADANEIAFLNTVLDPNGQFECDGRIIKRHKNFLPIATINPYDEMHGGTQPMNLALVNRFGMQIEIDYPSNSEEIQLLLAIMKNENPDAISAEGADGEEKMWNVCAILVKVANKIRKVISTHNTDGPIRDRLQKIKMATDFLMNAVKRCDNARDLIQIIFDRISLNDEDKKILRAINLEADLATLLAETSRYI